MVNPFKTEMLANSIRRKRLRRLPRPGKILYPKNIENVYVKDLETIVDKLFALVEKHLVSKLKSITEKVALERGTKLDAYGDDLTDIVAAINIEFQRDYSPSEISALAKRTGKNVDYWNDRQLSGSVKSLTDLDLFGREPWLSSKLAGFATGNVDLIKGMTDEFLNDVKGKTLRAIETGKRWEEIAGEIFDTYEVTKNHAKLIARDQIGKLQGSLTELRQKEVGVDQYVWRTAGDGRVREGHQENDGKTFSWSDPPATGHPGQDIQCRCYAEPVLSKFISDL